MENAELPGASRNRGGQQSLPYNYNEDDEFVDAGFSRDNYDRNDGDAEYDNGPEIGSNNTNSNTISRRNAGHFGGNRHIMGDTEYYNANALLNVEEYDDEEMEDSEGLYVSEKIQANSTQTSTQSLPRTPTRGGKRKQGEFTVPFAPNPRLPSRSSGTHIQPAYVNKAPPKVPTDSISNATLLKRGLTRSKDSVMSKRSHGANDPENILIVNLKENEQYSWREIAEALNERRIQEGKPPRFTPNSVQNRYNRNAPILFAAEGRVFIPVSQRRRGNTTHGPMKWDEASDTLLVKATKEVDSQRWTRVAELFNKHSAVEITAAEAAKRMEII